MKILYIYIYVCIFKIHAYIDIKCKNNTYIYVCECVIYKNIFIYTHNINKLKELASLGCCVIECHAL